VGEHGGTQRGYIAHIICLSWKGSILDLLEREDIRLHDGDNKMRGEGGERIGGGLKLYTKATC
jgi:hypothetical protein